MDQQISSDLFSECLFITSRWNCMCVCLSILSYIRILCIVSLFLARYEECSKIITVIGAFPLFSYDYLKCPIKEINNKCYAVCRRVLCSPHTQKNEWMNKSAFQTWQSATCSRLISVLWHGGRLVYSRKRKGVSEGVGYIVHNCTYLSYFHLYHMNILYSVLFVLFCFLFRFLSKLFCILFL